MVRDAFDAEVAGQARLRASWLRDMGFDAAATELDSLAHHLENAIPYEYDDQGHSAA